MFLDTIFCSSSQRRPFLLATLSTILFFVGVLWSIYHFVLELSAWNLVAHILVTMVSSAAFALVSLVYLRYFFRHQTESSPRTDLAPDEISNTLTEMAERALEYRLFVRTGRHFRADVLPVLIKNAIKNRREVTIEAILLDFRNYDICEKYASYRGSASFDRKLWDRRYVQTAILATIFKLIQAVEAHPSLIRLNLFLSTRLSTFRIDASHEQLIITREDPKDPALRYRSSDKDFSAFMNEFNWTRDGAFAVREITFADSTKTTIQNMFGDCEVIADLEEDVLEAIHEPSPYPR